MCKQYTIYHSCKHKKYVRYSTCGKSVVHGKAYGKRQSAACMGWSSMAIEIKDLCPACVRKEMIKNDPNALRIGTFGIKGQTFNGWSNQKNTGRRTSLLRNEVKPEDVVGHELWESIIIKADVDSNTNSSWGSSSWGSEESSTSDSTSISNDASDESITSDSSSSDDSYDESLWGPHSGKYADLLFFYQSDSDTSDDDDENKENIFDKAMDSIMFEDDNKENVCNKAMESIVIDFAIPQPPKTKKPVITLPTIFEDEEA